MKKNLKILIKTAKSIYYPKRTYDQVFKDSNLGTEKINKIHKFFQENKVDIKKQDAIMVLEYVKNMK